MVRGSYRRKIKMRMVQAINCGDSERYGPRLTFQLGESRQHSAVHSTSVARWPPRALWHNADCWYIFRHKEVLGGPKLQNWKDLGSRRWCCKSLKTPPQCTVTPRLGNHKFRAKNMAFGIQCQLYHLKCKISVSRLTLVPPLVEIIQSILQPWLVWLSGLSTGLRTQGSVTTWAPVGAAAWVAGGPLPPPRDCRRGTQ